MSLYVLVSNLIRPGFTWLAPIAQDDFLSDVRLPQFVLRLWHRVAAREYAHLDSQWQPRHRWDINEVHAVVTATTCAMRGYHLCTYVVDVPVEDWSISFPQCPDCYARLAPDTPERLA